MSIVKFELKDDHIKLLKYLHWNTTDEMVTYMDEQLLTPYIHNKGGEDDHEGDLVPFGFNTIYEGMNLILNGKTGEVDAFESNDTNLFTQEQKDAWLKLYKELPTALEIILLNQTFETGWYQSQYPLRNWKRSPKQ